MKETETETMINMEKLEKIIRLQKQKSHISIELNKLSIPLISDIGKINEIYYLFVSILGHVPKGMERKMFILIILYMFSPTSLIGGKTRSGVRNAISALFPSKSSSWISNSCHTVLFYYRTYKSFRHKVDNIFSEIKKKI